MPGNRHGARHGNARTQLRDIPLRLPGDVAEAHGPTWGAFAAQSALWSMVLLEIPIQVTSHMKQRTDALMGRLDELQLSHPEDPEIADIENRLRMVVECRVATVGDCTTASVLKTVGEWPDSHEVAVEFAMGRDGELKIRCLRTPDHLPRLPGLVPFHPDTMAAAKSKAAHLVGAAVRLVDGEFGRRLGA